MNRIAFLTILQDGLGGLPAREVDDIVADYTAYFDEAHASGRSEEEVAAALGDPRRLARELRAEAGLRHWENHRSLGNTGAALLALGGLAAVDLLLLLPQLFALTLGVPNIGLAIVAHRNVRMCLFVMLCTCGCSYPTSPVLLPAPPV